MTVKTTYKTFAVYPSSFQSSKDSKNIGQNLILWVSRQFLRRLVKTEFRVAENESDSAPFSIAKFPQKLSISNFLFFYEKNASKDAKSEMHFCKGKSRYLSKY